MRDEDRTREQLLEEVRALRRRLARAEGAGAGPPPGEGPDRFPDLLGMLLRHAPVPIFVNSPDGRCLLANRAWEDLVGFRLEDVRGRRHEDLFPEATARRFHETDRRVAEAGAALAFEEDVETRRGRRHYQTIKFPLRDAAGAVRAVGGLSMDLTDRRRAEEGLRESEERFRQLAEHIREVFWVTDPDGPRQLYVSPAYEEVWGRTCRSLYEDPLSWLEAVHPEDRARVEATSAQSLAEGHGSVEFRVVRPDGSVRWVWDRAFPVRDAAGRLYRVVGIAEDVTERREARERLRESEERHRLISELTSDYAYTCRVDPGGAVVLDSVTEGFQSFLGYTLEEANRRGGWAGFIHPDDLPQTRAAAPRLLAGERVVDELRVVTKAGAVRWVRFSAHPVWDPAEGRVTRLLGAVVDVTERRRAEDALRESEGRLRGFFEAAFEGLVIHEGGVILDANRRFAEMFGYDPGEIIGRHVLDLSAPASREEVRRHLAGGDEGPYEAAGLRRDGTTFPGELRGKAVSYRGRPARVTAVRDVTERKRAEGQLREYAGRLEALSRRLLEVQEQERRALARELHDEVGQVLTGLRLSLGRCTAGAGAEARGCLEEAEGLLRELTGRVRDLSLRLRPSMLDDLGLIPALVWLVERYTAQTGVRVAFEHGGLPGRFPRAAETAAYRIVQESLTNVARHAGVREAVVRLWADAGSLGVQVEDRGAGFDVPAATRSGEAHGLLGMRERARLLGGRLEIDAAPGRGTRVTAELPLREGDPNQPADAR